MHARPGDRICVNSQKVSQEPRMGTVLAVKEGAAGDMYRIAWDDGSTSMFKPTAGIAMVMSEPAVHVTEDDGGPSNERFGCRIDISVVESETVCEATASLMTARGHFKGEGRARRHPEDPSVPLIGEELAIARALSHLSDALMSAATDAIDDHESRPIHLLQAT